MPPRWLKLGRVGKAHGLQGAFFVSGREDPIPKSYGDLILGSNPESGERFKVRGSRMQGDRPILHFESLTRREHAEQYAGQDIWVERDKVLVNSSTEYLWSDLYGRCVVDSEGTQIGVVHRVTNFGASDILQVKGDQGYLDVPLIAPYVSLTFDQSPELRLLVPAQTFFELWYEQENA